MVEQPNLLRPVLLALTKNQYQKKRKGKMKMRNPILFIVIIVLIVAAMLAVAAPALASASCTYNAQHGWHLVGGGQQNDHWYETEEECIASLATPTETTPVITETPDPTEEPTQTPDPTEEVTETPEPTEEVTATPEPTIVVTTSPTAFVRGLGCYSAWQRIVTDHGRDIGYRYFEKPDHLWCQDWLVIKFGINYDHYKLTHP